MTYTAKNMTNKKTLEEIKWLLVTQDKFHWWRVVEGAMQMILFLLLLLGFQFVVVLISKI